MTTQSEAIALFSSDELAYLLANLPSLPGPANELGLDFSLPHLAVTTESKAVIRRSLFARGYLTDVADNEAAVEPFLVTVLQAVLNPAQRLDLQIVNRFTQAIDITQTLLVPGMTVSHLPLPNDAHEFRVFDETPDFAGDIMGLMPAIPTNLEHLDLVVTRTAFDDAWDRIGIVNQAENIENLEPLQQAIRLALRSEFLVSLSRWISDIEPSGMEKSSNQLLSFVWDDATMVVIEDPLPNDPDGPLHIHSVTTTELSGLLTAWLAPLAAHTSLA